MVRDRLTKLLTLRISPGEYDMLERLSEDTGLPMSAVVRQLIRRDHATRYGETLGRPAAAKKRKR
ncbi:MAG TPA: hypothetical protein VFR23_26205 [Jiangellaceae bacterium]|nr:hypothetical protein [Jiangellaceae bacterium]